MPRCAIYTRKSTEEGLEQDFNSLDAQREACEAYLKSQRHEGWRAIAEPFDDGGSSGGTMDRPALTRLLEAVKESKVDVVVVYKVDRLTRSLADFAKIVELFDAHGVSFVSVTQQFNTTTSMGRLTLNVLLSFAQFEREVTAERIRDKIAASKKKGIWMGGQPPLGYDVEDRKLVINEAEAETVRQLYQMYLSVGSVRCLKSEVDRLGIVTKQRATNGRSYGGKPFSRGNLYRLLSNPLYIGKIPHKGEAYPGQHQAILDDQLWDAVQKQLSFNGTTRRSRKNTKSATLLAGLAYDETGDRLTPTHANKNGRRYRYYASHRLVHGMDRKHGGWRIPTRVLDRAVLDLIRGFLEDEQRLMDELSLRDVPASTLGTVRRNAKKLADELQMGRMPDDGHKTKQILRRVDLGAQVISVTLGRRELAKCIGAEPTDNEPRGADDVMISTQVRLQRRGVEAKLIMDAPRTRGGVHDVTLCRLIARSHVWFDKLASGEVDTVSAIAKSENVQQCDVSRALRLAFLAPDIVEAVLMGQQPVELTADMLRKMVRLPTEWAAQHHTFRIID